ncbi:MAG: hypothetical protein V4787_20630, partial [Pseudomonadota bacterium]
MFRNATSRATKSLAGNTARSIVPKSTAPGNRTVKPARTTPFTQARRPVSIGHIPTDLQMQEPGHVALYLDMYEQQAMSLKSGEIGHQPDTKGRAYRREDRVSRDGHKYTNVEKRAADPGRPYPKKASEQIHLGMLKPMHQKVLAHHLENWPRRYALSGTSAGPVPKNQMTLQDVHDFLKSGVIPVWAPNCVDAIAGIAKDWARTECTDESALRVFEKAIDKATKPEALHRVIARYFTPNFGGYMTFEAKGQAGGSDPEDAGSDPGERTTEARDKLMRQ